MFIFFYNFIQGNNLICSSKKYFNFTWLNLETAAHLNQAPGGTGWLSAGCRSGAGDAPQPLHCCCFLPGVPVLGGSGGAGSCRGGQGSSQDLQEFSHALTVSTMKEFCATEYCAYNLAARQSHSHKLKYNSPVF